MLVGNAIVGQSGGPTSAINATLAGVIRQAGKSEYINTLYGMVNGKHEEANSKNAVVIDGEYWFENEHYVEPIEEIVETMKEMVDDVVDETDYKTLYEEELTKNKAFAKEINALTQELQKVKGEFADYKAIVEAFKRL